MEIRMSVDTKGSAKTALTDALTAILALCNLQELRGNAERKDGGRVFPKLLRLLLTFGPK